jgi:hypothetical protein
MERVGYSRPSALSFLCQILSRVVLVFDWSNFQRIPFPRGEKSDELSVASSVHGVSCLKPLIIELLVIEEATADRLRDIRIRE